jgi:hypothetical protein
VSIDSGDDCKYMKIKHAENGRKGKKASKFKMRGPRLNRQGKRPKYRSQEPVGADDSMTVGHGGECL